MQGLKRNGYEVEAGILLIFLLVHFVLISGMLGFKFYYLFEEKVIAAIDRCGEYCRLLIGGLIEPVPVEKANKVSNSACQVDDSHRV